MKYLSILFFTLLLLSCHGWGYALTRWSATRNQYPFAFLSVIGVAVLIFLGGVLNLVRLAYPLALSILLLTGLTFFAIYCAEHAKTWLAACRANGSIDLEKLKSLSGQVVPIGILITAVSFYALTLLPAAAFNFSDDFYTYLPRPFRMLQTGTLAGNPFEVLGIDSVGGLAFLQGFILIGLPVGHILGLDAVFGFALAGLLLIAFSKKLNLHWSATAFALVVFMVINPQSVNVSALYLSSALILGVLFASFHLLDQLEKSVRDAIPINAVGLLGVLTAGSIALKSTQLTYVLAYLACFFTGLFLISKDRRKIFKIGSLVVLFTLVALLPWLVLHATHYASIVHAALQPTTAMVGSTSSVLKGDITRLFSTGELYYGDSFLSYGVIVLMLAAVGTYSSFNTFGNRYSSSQRGYFLIAASSCAAGVINYLFYGAIFPPPLVVRYSCSMLIATLPFALLVASMSVSNTSLPAKLLTLPSRKILMILSMPLLVTALFWSTFVKRAELAYYFHMTMQFPFNNNYIEYNRYATSLDARKEIRDIQYKTEPDQKIFAWISTPMHLDFSRNEIHSFIVGGLLNPWLNMPLDGSTNDMMQYLKAQGIRYILWEYSSRDKSTFEDTYNRWLASPYASYRRQAERALYLRNTLAAIMNKSSYLYNENGIVLIDLQQIHD